MGPKTVSNSYCQLHVCPSATDEDKSNVSYLVTVYIVLITLIQLKLECGPMPNVMVALPNIGGALCSTPQSLADAHY